MLRLLTRTRPSLGLALGGALLSLFALAVPALGPVSRLLPTLRLTRSLLLGLLDRAALGLRGRTALLLRLLAVATLGLLTVATLGSLTLRLFGGAPLSLRLCTRLRLARKLLGSPRVEDVALILGARSGFRLGRELVTCSAGPRGLLVALRRRPVGGSTGTLCLRAPPLGRCACSLGVGARPLRCVVRDSHLG